MLPTDSDDWTRMGSQTARVLRRPRWLLIAVVSALLALALFVAVTSPVYVRTVVVGGHLSPLERLRAFVAVFPFVGAGDDLVRQSILVGVACVTGVNVAMVGYHLTRDRTTLSGSSGSFLGVVLGTLGAGCASCGIAIAGGIFSLLGGPVGLSILPFGGIELLFAALLATVLSLHWLVEGMRANDVEGCPVDR